MDINTLGPLTLAYLGDALMSVKVRQYLIEKGYTKPQDLQKRTIQFVSAKAQASFVKALIEQNYFTEDEILILKRGRNAKSNSVPKNTDVITYNYATALETLWGYLYLKEDTERLESLWQEILKIKEK